MFISTNSLFKDLTAEEVELYRQYARDNYDSLIADLHHESGKWTLWHPVTVAELFKLREEVGG